MTTIMTFNISKEVQVMSKQESGGNIINMSSVCGQAASPAWPQPAEDHSLSGSICTGNVP